MADNNVPILRKEFYAFWKAGLNGSNFVDESAIVCFLDIDHEEVTLTRIFYCIGNGARAEDHMIDWFCEEQLIQTASKINMFLYMNYSPLKLTADGLISVLKDLKETGKEVSVDMKFVELYKTSGVDDDSEENCEGLRQLQKFGVRVEVMKTRDWLFLMQTLLHREGKKHQSETSKSAHKRLRVILKSPHDAETSTEAPEVTEEETMTDAPPEVPVVQEEKDSSSSSSDGE